jgi:hypothetical protein
MNISRENLLYLFIIIYLTKLAYTKSLLYLQNMIFSLLVMYNIRRETVFYIHFDAYNTDVNYTLIGLILKENNIFANKFVCYEVLLNFD